MPRRASFSNVTSAESHTQHPRIIFQSHHSVLRTPTMAAVDKVIAIPELLEQLILPLPLRQMLLIQRVCTSFRDIVLTSPKISRALFFDPSTEETLQWHDVDDASKDDQDSLQVGWVKAQGDIPVLPVVNPFLFQYVTLAICIPQLADFHSIGFKAKDSDVCAKIKSFSPGGLTNYDQYHNGTDPYLLHAPCRRMDCIARCSEFAGYLDISDGFASVERLADRLQELTSHLMSASTSSCKNMLVTHTPCDKIRFIADKWFPCSLDYQQEPDAEGDDPGVRVGSFASATMVTSIQERLEAWTNHATTPARYKFVCMKPSTIQIEGGESLRVCPKSIDEMTGWEMLRLLSMDIEELDMNDFE